jgi:hypothetical protein
MAVIRGAFLGDNGLRNMTEHVGMIPNVSRKYTAKIGLT